MIINFDYTSYHLQNNTNIIVEPCYSSHTWDQESGWISEVAGFNGKLHVLMRWVTELIRALAFGCNLQRGCNSEAWNNEVPPHHDQCSVHMFLLQSVLNRRPHIIPGSLKHLD